MADLLVKPDPDSKSPGVFDEDIYEDAGDLEFNNDPAFQSVYMAKVPRYVWEAWSKLNDTLANMSDDAEIRIGTIRQSSVTVNNQKRHRLQMLLTSDIKEHQLIPKEYDLEMVEESVNNTFVFAEQDLPGYKSKSKQKFDLASANMPARLTRPSKVEKTKQPYDPNRKFVPQYRKAVPKRTTLRGRVKHELNCVPVDNDEAKYLMRLMTEEAMKPKHVTKYLKEDVSHSNSAYIQPGTVAASKSFGGFIKTKGQGTGNRPQLSKAARIPQNELLDKIFACFRRYTYWSMKALRNELKQPEAYIRETLEPIAVLARTGTFHGQWSLKAENRVENLEGLLEEEAPDVGPNDSDTGMDDDDDDDDIKMEDVL
ncbi:transcription initiation factor IIF, beta subunit [Bisporella sp. PMI_857]|nr:transcription initiation factor IIF, beta subunit [Bisporella sp. PMI_857]